MSTEKLSSESNLMPINATEESVDKTSDQQKRRGKKSKEEKEESKKEVTPKTFKGFKPKEKEKENAVVVQKTTVKGFDPDIEKLFQPDKAAETKLDLKPNLTENNLSQVEILGDPIKFDFIRDEKMTENQIRVGPIIYTWEGKDSLMIEDQKKTKAIIPGGVDLHSTLLLSSFLLKNSDRDGEFISSAKTERILKESNFDLSKVKLFMTQLNLGIVVLNLSGETIMPDPNRLKSLNGEKVGTLGYRYDTSATMVNGLLLYKVSHQQTQEDGYFIELTGPHQAGKTFDGVNWARYTINDIKQRLFKGIIVDPYEWVTTNLPHRYLEPSDKPSLGTSFDETFGAQLPDSVRKNRLETNEKEFYRRIFDMAGAKKRNKNQKEPENPQEMMWTRIERGYQTAKFCCLTGIQFRDFYHYTKGFRDSNKTSLYKLRNLIITTYPWSLDKQHIFDQINYSAMLNWDEELKQRFLTQIPVLEKWLPIMNKTRDPEIWNFVLLFLEVQGIIVDPNFWCGRNLNFVIILYYVQCSNSHLLYVEDDDAYYRYNQTFWLQISELDLITEVKSFYSSHNAVSGISKFLSVDNKNLLNEQVKDHVTIESWPKITGFNCDNGFVTLHNGVYVLRPHHPGNFQRDLFKVSLGPLTSQPLAPITQRFTIDLAGNRVLSGQLNKLADFISISPGKHNIIINYTGNPRGAKTQKVNLLSKIVGDGFNVGDFNSMNTFQLRDTFFNKTLVVFADADLTRLKTKSKECLKRVSGRDAIFIEQKYGRSGNTKTRCTPLITSNTSLEEFRLATDPGLADRLLTIRLPQVDTSARVPGLSEQYLTKPLWMNNLFGYIITINSGIINGAIRAGTINEITGSKKKDLFERFLSENLIGAKGNFVSLTKLKANFQDFTYKLLADNKISKTDYNRAMQKGSYQEDTNNFLSNWNPKPEYKRRSSGFGWVGIAFANASYNETYVAQDVREDEPSTRLSNAAQNLLKLLLDNPLKQNYLCFHESSGVASIGPALNPFINLYTFLNYLKVRNTNMRSLIFGKLEGIQNNNHLESTGFGGNQKLANLGFKDFFEMGQYQFQPIFVPKTNHDLDQDIATGRFIYHKTDLSDLFTGADHGMLITGKPLYNSGFAKSFQTTIFNRQYGLIGDWNRKIYVDLHNDAQFKKMVTDALEPPKAIAEDTRPEWLLPWKGEHYLEKLKKRFKRYPLICNKLLNDLLTLSVDELVQVHSLEALEKALQWFENYYLNQLKTTSQKELFCHQRNIINDLLKSFEKAFEAPIIKSAYALVSTSVDNDDDYDSVEEEMSYSESNNAEIIDHDLSQIVADKDNEWYS